MTIQTSKTAVTTVYLPELGEVEIEITHFEPQTPNTYYSEADGSFEWNFVDSSLEKKIDAHAMEQIQTELMLNMDRDKQANEEGGY